jgi:hypothetical protein
VESGRHSIRVSGARMAGEAVGSGIEVQGQGKGSLISGPVGDEALQVESDAGIQDGGEWEGEGDEEFEDVRIF